MLNQAVYLGEVIIPLKNGVALVASKSTVGGWHVVRGGKRDCAGYQHRGQCRHVAAVQALQSAPPVETSQDTEPVVKTTSTPAAGSGSAETDSERSGHRR
jgi:hypothetical protein